MVHNRIGSIALTGVNLLAVGALAVSGFTAVGAASSAVDAQAMPDRNGDCYREGAALNVEEQRITLPLPGQSANVSDTFIDAGGFRSILERFERRLCTLSRVSQADTVLPQLGAELWETAVERAQGEREMGSIDPYDDRPLYWTRAAMTRAIREWQPRFSLTSLQRQTLLQQFNYASRGIGQVDFPEGEDVTRVLISGFDTFSLDSSLRNSNPSGASALQLDGHTVETEDGTVVVQAVMLPVNWTDFDQGIVEDAFAPWMVPADHPEHEGTVDAIMTISQTGRGRMDIEKWAGNFRGGSPDNNRAMNFGPISRHSLWPQPQPSPQFIQTTLPYQEMIDAGTGPWPVVLNDGITEWPAGTYPRADAIRRAPDPSPGSRAASAPGGNYLSNESMYRTNRLRLGLGLTDLPGGHLHISSLRYPTDPTAITSPDFEADRKAIVDQTVSLVEAAGIATQD